MGRRLEFRLLEWGTAILVARREVGAVGGQILDGLILAEPDGRVERRRAVGRCHVHIDPQLDEHAHGLEFPAAGREQDRAGATGVPILGIGPQRDQELHHFDVAIGRGQQKRRDAPVCPRM